jgi:hypothetical protein
MGLLYYFFVNNNIIDGIENKSRKNNKQLISLIKIYYYIRLEIIIITRASCFYRFRILFPKLSFKYQ